MTAAAKAVADKIDREREREVRNCSILFWTVRFAYEVLPVVMIEILATVLCVRISPSSFLSPTIRLQSMHVLVAERQLRQSAAGQSLATQLNSTLQLWTRLIVGGEADARCVALFARTLLDNSLKSGARTAATATVHCCCCCCYCGPSPTSFPLI